MQGRAIAKYVRVAPRKARLVVDAIRGKSVTDAENILRFLPKGAAEVVSKVLNSAKHNATNNFDMQESQLFVKSTCVDVGPTLKRVLPRARGRGDTMKKRTSHITIIVEERHGK
jgi:large subunit ribosomal protein L22